MFARQVVLVVFLSLVLHVQGTTNQLFMVGDFAAMIIDGNSLERASGVVSYDPITDTFTPLGEVLLLNDLSTINILASTPMGIFGAGSFSHINKNFEYSEGILQYDPTTNQYLGLNGGIWKTPNAYPQAVQYIASITNYTVFAGAISIVLEISQESYKAGEPNVLVPNIVKMDSNNNYSLLDDPNQTFQCSTQYASPLTGLAASHDGSKIFVLCNSVLYSWDQENHYQVLNSYAGGEILPKTLVVDANNNVFATMEIGYYGGCSVAFFNAQNNYAKSYLHFTCICYNYPVFVLPWNGGVLFALFSTFDCDAITFSYFNSTTGVVVNSTIPGLSLPTETQIYYCNGAGNDVWAYSTFLTLVYYYSAASNQWYQHTLFSDNYSIRSMAWDSSSNSLLVYLNHFDEIEPNTLVKVTLSSTNEFIVRTLIVGNLASTGSVQCITALKQQNSDNYDIFIAGQFTHVNGTSATNVAKYSNGVWSAANIISPENPIYYMSTSGVNLYYTFNSYGYPGQGTLGIGGINTHYNIFTIPTTPTVLEGYGNVATIYAEEILVYFGGEFQVSVPDGTASHVVVYDTQKQYWFGLGIPFVPFATVQSISRNSVNGTNYLCIAGSFNFTISGFVYTSVAFYNLDTSSWAPYTVAPFDSASPFELPNIYDALFSNSGTVYVGGDLHYDQYSTAAGVASYNIFNPSSFSPFPQVYSNVRNLAFATNNTISNPTLFACGMLNIGANTPGLIYFSDVDYPQGGTWAQAGRGNLFYNYFSGYGYNLIQSDGSKGI